MARKRMPTESETNALVESRRRCCLCFALERKTEMNAGQIAHLDGNSSNHSPTNLAFLCLKHHDEYDSSTSQSQGFKIQEVKAYKQELLEWLGSAPSQKVDYGILSLPPDDPYAGQWITLETDESPAEVRIIPLPESPEGQARYFVCGETYHGVSRDLGPNLGFLEFYSEITEENSLHYSRPSFSGSAVTELTFTQDGYMRLQEDDVFGQYGVGVTFAGVYQRVS